MLCYVLKHMTAKFEPIQGCSSPARLYQSRITSSLRGFRPAPTSLCCLLVGLTSSLHHADSLHHTGWIEGSDIVTPTCFVTSAGPMASCHHIDWLGGSDVVTLTCSGRSGITMPTCFITSTGPMASHRHVGWLGGSDVNTSTCFMDSDLRQNHHDIALLS